MSIMKQIKTALNKIWLLEQNTTMCNIKRIHKQHAIEFKMVDSWVNLSVTYFSKYVNIFYFMLSSMNLDGTRQFYFINKKGA